jgi:Uma2 family endonuclease
MGSAQAITFVSESVVSQEEFARWVAERPADDPNRYELLEGKIVMNPPVRWPEGEGELSIGALLRSYVVSRRLGRVFGPSQGFELPTGDTVAPDASYISQERWQAGPRPEPGQFLRIVPDLAVEVVSPSDPTRDRVQKRILYAQAGIREYWIVDLRRREVTLFFSLVEGRFEAGQTLTEQQTLRSRALPGLEIPVAELLVSA